MTPTPLETRSTKSETDVRQIAQDIVHRAMAGGAITAESVVRDEP
jgi:hypothetical protein